VICAVIAKNAEIGRFCDIYFHEKGFQLLEARYEEEWHEKRLQKGRALMPPQTVC